MTKLTYIATMSALDDLLASKALLRYLPVEPPAGFVQIRELFVTEEVWQACPPDDDKAGPHALKLFERNKTQVVFEGFVGGMPIQQGIGMKLLIPQDENVWELKIIPGCGVEQLRFFGWFIGKDQLVLTNYDYRGDCPKRFEPQREKCKRVREKRFGSLPIFSVGTLLTDYIVNAEEEVSED